MAAGIGLPTRGYTLPPLPGLEGMLGVFPRVALGSPAGEPRSTRGYILRPLRGILAVPWNRSQLSFTPGDGRPNRGAEDARVAFGQAFRRKEALPLIVAQLHKGRQRVVVRSG